MGGGMGDAREAGRAVAFAAGAAEGCESARVSRRRGRSCEWGGVLVRARRCRASRVAEAQRSREAADAAARLSENVSVDGRDGARKGESGEKAEKNAQAALGLGSAYALLNAVAVIWGSQHAVIKAALTGEGAGSEGAIEPSVLNALRFATSAVVFLPALLRPGSNIARGSAHIKPKSTRDLIVAGGELGLWMFAGFALQSIGLEYTSAGRSAFLLYLNVKLVPLFAWLFYGRHIERTAWISAAVAVLGTLLLSTSDNGVPINIGDGLSVAAAVSSAVFILRLEVAAARFNAEQLNAVSLLTTATLSCVWVLSTLPGSSGTNSVGSLAQIAAHASPSLVAVVLYLGVVSTAFGNWAQTVGQRVVSAERAALIYALDPVYAALFAYVFLGESLSETGLLGAGLIAGAALYSRLDTMRRSEQSTRAPQCEDGS